MSWETAKLGDILAKVKRAGKLKASEYETEGLYPVIDQGQNVVAGYSDNADIVQREPLPIVVFGDHTRCVKFVNEPFICGADGTQLLFPNRDDIDPSFFYYAVKNVDLSNYAYARHFKFLKDQEISFPNLPSQERIAAILSAYDDLIENNRRRIALLEQATRLLYREWFVHFRFPGHETARFKDGLPEGWNTSIFDDVCQTVGGGTPSTKVSSYWEDGDVTWVTPTDITRNDCLALLDGEKKITREGLNKSSAKLVPPHTILMTSRASVGFFGIADKEVCTNQGFINIIPNIEVMRYYLLFNLLHRVEEIRAHAGGSTYTEISKSKFRALPVIQPDNETLEGFDAKVRPILDQVRALKKGNAQLTAARDLLLPRLMDGRIPVAV